MASLRMWLLATLTVGAAGCAMPPGSNRVAAGAAVAMLEGHISTPFATNPYGSTILHYVDGEKTGPYTCQSIHLAPGAHVIHVVLAPATRGSRAVGVLKTEVRLQAGHNYRVYQHGYDDLSSSIWIEDIDTGQVVCGRRPMDRARP